MMTTFSAMPWSFAVKALIIGIVVLALGACSLVRVGYGNGPALACWWLDGYLDLDEAQEAAARPLLRDWFAWHRATQLPDYARWLDTWRERAGGEVSADEICRWTDLARNACGRPSKPPCPLAHNCCRASRRRSGPIWRASWPIGWPRSATSSPRPPPRRAGPRAGALRRPRRVLLRPDQRGPAAPAGRGLGRLADAHPALARRPRTPPAALRRCVAHGAGRARCHAPAGRAAPGGAGPDAAGGCRNGSAAGASAGAGLRADGAPAREQHTGAAPAPERAPRGWEEDLRALAAAGAS